MPEPLATATALSTRAGDAAAMLGRLPFVRVRECVPDAAFWLQFVPGDVAVATALTTATGLTLNRGDRVAQKDSRSMLWMGPGNWLLVADDGGEYNTQARGALLERGLAGVACSVTDVSDLWFRMHLQGICSRDVLAKGCALDLDPEAFPPGASAVMQFARIRALIHHLDASTGYHVYVERSFARYAWAWLADAMAEYLD